MAELWYGHFDSAPEDPRKLLAEQWARYIESFITSGIRNGGTCLQVTENQGMTVKVDTGIANVRGYIMQINEDLNGRYYNVAIPPSHPQYPRIDRLVLRLDRSIAVRSVIPAISMGVADANPAPPSLQRTETGIYELSLAQIKVAANATVITKSNIIDERFQTDLCGLMHSILGLDPSAWQRQFDDFLQSIQAVNDAYKAALQSAFNDLLSGFQSDYDAWKAIINSWKDLTVTQLAMVLTANFDNQLAYPGTTKTVTRGERGVVTGTIKYTASGATFIQQTTQRNPTDGSITETQTVYNTDGTVFNSVQSVATVNNGVFTAEVTSV